MLHQSFAAEGVFLFFPVCLAHPVIFQMIACDYRFKELLDRGSRCKLGHTLEIRFCSVLIYLKMDTFLEKMCDPQVDSTIYRVETRSSRREVYLYFLEVSEDESHHKF